MYVCMYVCMYVYIEVKNEVDSAKDDSTLISVRFCSLWYIAIVCGTEQCEKPKQKNNTVKKRKAFNRNLILMTVFFLHDLFLTTSLLRIFVL